MRPPDQRDDPQGRTLWGACLSLVATVAIMVTGCLSAFLVLQLDDFRPKLGDFVVFRPGSQDAELWHTAIPASTLSATGLTLTACTLDPDEMAASGGSLVVEGRFNLPASEYRVHWAGSRTAKGADDCGSAVNLALSRADLQRLANAAGGFGVGGKGIRN